MLNRLNKRAVLLLIVLMCSLSLAYSFYAQYYSHVIPCPLCIAQRVIIAVIDLIAVVAILHNPHDLLVRIYGLLIVVVSFFGIKIAAHHIWLIQLPANQQPLACGMPLAVLYRKLPLHGFVSYVLRGDAECAQINWKIFGVSAPEAVLVLLIIVAICGLYLFLGRSSSYYRRMFK